MNDVVIAGYLRTAQSRSRPKDPGRDWLFKIRSDDMMASLLPPLLEQAGVEKEEVDDFILGCAQAVSEQWSMGGRGPLLLANMSPHTSCKSVDQQCGSALAGMQIGFMEIAMGYADVVACGGMEHMTRVPMGADGATDFNLRYYCDPSMMHWDMMTAMNMGQTAEKLAKLGDLSREDMDAWGVRSHQRAYEAQQSGFLAGEIHPLEVEQEGGGTMVVDQDQAIRSDTSMEEMAALRTPFKKDGRITVGSSSPLNAGATSLLLMSRQKAEEKGIKPLARVVSIGFAGVEPNLMGKGPVPATHKALAAAGLEAGDIDFWEINEAFSAVVL
ncbi:MAG: acetyl-CoA C-acyltransferase, partial [Planctomycetota bacterium]